MSNMRRNRKFSVSTGKRVPNNNRLFWATGIMSKSSSTEIETQAVASTDAIIPPSGGVLLWVDARTREGNTGECDEVIRSGTAATAAEEISKTKEAELNEGSEQSESLLRRVRATNDRILGDDDDNEWQPCASSGNEA